jgi:hypothetical protein
MSNASTVPDKSPIGKMSGNHKDAYVESGSGEDSSEAGMEASASDYEGKLQEAPVKMLFGPKECRRIFEQASDHNAFLRVCGNKDRSCKRGHTVLDQAREGYYDTVVFRKYVDGKLHTFQSKEERQTKLRQLKTLPFGTSSLLSRFSSSPLLKETRRKWPTPRRTKEWIITEQQVSGSQAQKNTLSQRSMDC